MTIRRHERALTELYGILLIVVLIGIAVVLILGGTGGVVYSLLQKPPAFAVQAKVTVFTPGRNVVTLSHLGGDAVSFSYPSSSGYTPGIYFTLESPDGQKIAVNPSPNMTGNPWAQGGSVTIYSDGSQFWATDNPATLAMKGNTAGIPPGIWIIYITDRQTQVVVNSLEATV